MLNFFKSIVNALSEYSFLPLPFYEDEGDKYKYGFVPLIGALIFYVNYGWFLLGWYRHFNDVAIALGIIIIVTIITGGRHVLGFAAYIDHYPTYKYRFKSWSESRDRGVLRFIIVLAVWFVAMLNTYDYIFPLLIVAFPISRIYMSLLSTICNDFTQQSKITIILLIVEYAVLNQWIFVEYESLAFAPSLVTLFMTLIFINKFRKSTIEALPLLEDDFIISAETTWLFSVSMVCLIQSI